MPCAPVPGRNAAGDCGWAGAALILIGAIWMKSSINLMREGREQPELKMIGREPENPALKAFIRG